MKTDANYYCCHFSPPLSNVQLCHVVVRAERNKEHLAVMNCEAKWPMSAIND